MAQLDSELDWMDFDKAKLIERTEKQAMGINDLKKQLEKGEVAMPYNIQ